MIERKSYTMVIGCGEKGAAWIAKRSSEQVIGLDLKRPKATNGPLIIGDVFNLPIKTGAIDQIHADFIVNGLIDREIAAAQICENPDVLDSSYFPELVRRWFVESMSKSHDSVRRNIKEVSTLLKTVALREIWRILANNGRLQILDFQYNINWITHYAPQIVNENPSFIKLQPLRVSSEDFGRSESLGKVVKGSTYVQKLELIKTYPAVGTNLSLSGFSNTKL
jgi:SAM-dependent methyltransferase